MTVSFITLPMLTYFFGHPFSISGNRGDPNLCSLGVKRSRHSHLCSASWYDDKVSYTIEPWDRIPCRDADQLHLAQYITSSNHLYVPISHGCYRQTNRQTDTHTYTQARTHTHTHTRTHTRTHFTLLLTCIYILTHNVSKFACDVKTSIVLIAVHKVLLCIHTG